MSSAPAHILTDTKNAAISVWLANSLHRPSDAYTQWADRRLAVLALGSKFCAFRLSDELVHGVGTDSGFSLASTTLRTLDGPVIHDPGGRRFYALVPPAPPGPDLGPHAAYLGLGHFVGVPRVGEDEQTETWASYWAVPMSWPGTLCDPARVLRLIRAGTALLGEGADS
ncbi:hypothetical protein ACGFW5_22430 [Streptomyces sp. NPDC048416]|uniref:hypothetical protein n=1 Tax=Streptomyces sp. NPDC048416 TaxID=3365546 RepID=UPI0037160D6F